MYDENNIFAQIISGRISADKVYEDEQLLAINDIHPVAPVHILLIPKKQYTDYSDFITNASAQEVQHYFQTVVKIVEKLNIPENSYRLVTNVGQKSGQTVFHFHTHIIAGRVLNEAMG